MNFIIAQIIGIIITVICLIAPQFERKELIILSYTIANLLHIGLYYLLEQKSGVAMYIVATISTLVFYLYARKEKKAPFWVMLIFLLTLIVLTIITWDSWICIFILISAISIYGNWQKNLRILRISIIITTLSLGIYNILVMAYTGVINEFLQTISASIALWRYRKEKQKPIKVIEE